MDDKGSRVQLFTRPSRGLQLTCNQSIRRASAGRATGQTAARRHGDVGHWALFTLGGWPLTNMTTMAEFDAAQQMYLDLLKGVLLGQIGDVGPRWTPITPHGYVRRAHDLFMTKSKRFAMSKRLEP